MLLHLACALLAHAPAGDLHPQDGPDVDLTAWIEDEVVRLRVAPNLAYLDATVETARENAEFVHPVEVAGVRETLLEHWDEFLVVRVDGVRVPPLDVGFTVLDADPMLLPLFPRMGRLALTRVDHVLEFPCKAQPSRVELTWPDFPDDPQQPRGDGTFEPLEINGRLHALDRESLIQFSRRDPRFVWVREEAERSAEPLPVPAPAPAASAFPLASLVAVLVGAAAASVVVRRSPPFALVLVVAAGGAAFALRPTDAPDEFRVPDAEAALAAFLPLHANLYRAFDYSSEDAIYDALAESAEGGLLDDLYAEVYESMRLEDDGGAKSFVRSVDPLETEVVEAGRFAPDDAPGFRVDARWRVEGQVFHWGHSHTRTNLYRARYLVVATSAGWRLRTSEVLEHERERAAGDVDDTLVPRRSSSPNDLPEEL